MEELDSLTHKISVGERTPQELLHEFNDTSCKIISNKTNEIKNIVDSSQSYAEYYTERHERNKKGYSLGFNTGFDSIEIEKGQACLLAALPKQGKSMYAANIALNVSKKRKVIFFSFEMTEQEIMHRLLSIHSGQDINYFRNTQTSPEEVSEILSSFSEAYPGLKIYDKAITIEEVEDICKIEQMKNGLDFIVLDYIQRTPTKKQMELVQKTIHNSSKFKSMILNLRLGGVALSQFTRESAKKAFPSSNDLFGGEAMKQDFDQINILHNGSLDIETSEDRKYDPIYILRKTHDRNGGSLGDSLLRREKNKAKFTKEMYSMPSWHK